MTAADAAGPHHDETLEQRVLRSSLAAYAIQLAKLIIGVGSKLVLTRIVFAEGHGLYGLALGVVTVAAAVRDLGLPYHLVRDERRPYGTVLVATSVLGVGLTVALVLAAPLFSFFDPALPPYIQVFAIWVVLDGLAVVPRAHFERELTIGRLVLPELARTAVVAVVAIGLAAAGWEAWSFIVADLVAAALFAALVWRRVRGRIRLEPRLDLLPDLVRRSAWLFLIWLVLFLVTNVDRFIIAPYRNATEVGYYLLAYWLPWQIALIAYPRALFPSLVAYRNDPERFLETFRLAVVQILVVLSPAAFFLVLNAERTIDIIAPAGWEPAAAMLRTLAFVPFWLPITVGEVLKADERDRTWLAIELLNLASLVGVGLVLTARSGGTGMALANYALVGNIAAVVWVARRFGAGARRLGRDLLVLYLVPLPFFAVAALATEPASWTRFGASIAAGALAISVFVAIYLRSFRDFVAARRAVVEPGDLPGPAAAP